MKNEKLFMILAYPIIIFVAFVVVLFLATPVVLYSFPQIHKLFLTSTFVIEPADDRKAFTHIKGTGLRHFYITSGSSIVSVLHLIPKGKDLNDDDFKQQLNKSEYKIVMYFRSEKMNDEGFGKFCGALLEEDALKIQIIAFEYKGFGNTAGETTKAGAVEDARTVYNYLRQHAHRNSEIHFWSHGLGASIAAATLRALIKDNLEVKSIVLEAPFSDTYTQLKKKFFAASLYGEILPLWFFTNALDVIDLNFNTQDDIARVDVPTLILNAEADEDGQTAESTRKMVQFVRRHRDFIFHIEWRCKKVTHYPGQQASVKELKDITKGFHYATDIFWDPNPGV